MSLRCEVDVLPGMSDFDAVWDPTPFTEVGLNYAGKILITHRQTEPFHVKVPGIRSYDPGASSASKKRETIGSTYWSTMMSLLIAEIMAAKCGVQRDDVLKISEIGSNLV
jgi:hypothetical protein